MLTIMFENPRVLKSVTPDRYLVTSQDRNVIFAYCTTEKEAVSLAKRLRGLAQMIRHLEKTKNKDDKKK